MTMRDLHCVSCRQPLVAHQLLCQRDIASHQIYFTTAPCGEGVRLLRYPLAGGWPALFGHQSHHNLPTSSGVSIPVNTAVPYRAC